MITAQGYDTDDLTQRQYYVYSILKKHNAALASRFIAASIRQNHSLNKFDNYTDDCDFLKNIDQIELYNKYGINMKTLYV